ncbi:MAG: 2,3-diphosphoglycerate-dependent phosphoglycerate mutase [Gemmatimonadales bacterium]
MPTLILLRHGQSTWNKENRFTGWTDVGLTPEGEGEAREAARLLADAGYAPDLAFTSVLKRAIKTLWITLEALDRMWIPVRRDWRLNERHYGALQGLDKAETTAKHGADQVKRWRRSYGEPPPPLDPADPRHPSHDPRYAALPPSRLPATESLKDTVARVIPWWEESLVPELRAAKLPIVVAHGNSLRALVKFLDGVSEADILELNIPTGIPLVYELDASLRPVRRCYLGDADKAAAAAAAVARQASSSTSG